ncbi:hypothetical protein PHYSODRAFT_249218, partial [Phytophthora sojae]
IPVCCEVLVDYYDDPRKVSAVDKNAKDVGTGSVWVRPCLRRRDEAVPPYGRTRHHCRLVVHDNQLRCGWAIVFSSVTTVQGQA